MRVPHINIEINKIGLSNVTRAEGLALSHYVGGASLRGEDFAAYQSLLKLFRGFLGSEGTARGLRGEAPESFQERVNVFDEIAKDHLSYSYHSVPQSLSDQALDKLRSIQGNASSSTVEQYAQISGILSYIETVGSDNTGIKINVTNLKNIEDDARAQGIDVDSIYQSILERQNKSMSMAQQSAN